MSDGVTKKRKKKKRNEKEEDRAKQLSAKVHEPNCAVSQGAGDDGKAAFLANERVTKGREKLPKRKHFFAPKRALGNSACFVDGANIKSKEQRTERGKKERVKEKVKHPDWAP